MVPPLGLGIPIRESLEERACDIVQKKVVVEVEELPKPLLQTLLDSREEAACLLDADGIVLAANRAACRLIGEEGEALVGRPVSSCLEAIAEREETCGGTLKALADDMTEWAELVETILSAISSAEDGDEIIIYKHKEKPELMQ